MKNILIRLFIPVALCVCPLLISKLTGKDFRGVIIGYTLLATCYFYFSTFRKSIIDDRKKRSLILKFLLRKLVFEGISFRKISYRARIFNITQNFSSSIPLSLLFKKSLQEIASVNMEGTNDRDIIYYPYKGAPGLCWAIGEPLVYDFSTLDNENAKPWHFTNGEVELLKGIGATICMPLFKGKEVKGCLYIDTNNKLEDTPFNEKKFQESLKEWCKNFVLLI